MSVTELLVALYQVNTYVPYWIIGGPWSTEHICPLLNYRWPLIKWTHMSLTELLVALDQMNTYVPDWIIGTPWSNDQVSLIKFLLPLMTWLDAPDWNVDQMIRCTWWSYWWSRMEFVSDWTISALDEWMPMIKLLMKLLVPLVQMIHDVHDWIMMYMIKLLVSFDQIIECPWRNDWSLIKLSVSFNQVMACPWLNYDAPWSNG